MKFKYKLLIPVFSLISLSGEAFASDIQAPISSQAAQFVQLSDSKQKEAIEMTLTQNFKVFGFYRQSLKRVAKYAHNLNPAISSYKDYVGDKSDTNYFIHLYGKKSSEARDTLEANLILSEKIFKNEALNKTINEFFAYISEDRNKKISDKAMSNKNECHNWQVKIMNQINRLTA